MGDNWNQHTYPPYHYAPPAQHDQSQYADNAPSNGYNPPHVGDAPNQAPPPAPKKDSPESAGSYRCWDHDDHHTPRDSPNPMWSSPAQPQMAPALPMPPSSAFSPKASNTMNSGQAKSSFAPPPAAAPVVAPWNAPGAAPAPWTAAATSGAHGNPAAVSSSSSGGAPQFSKDPQQAPPSARPPTTLSAKALPADACTLSAKALPADWVQSRTSGDAHGYHNGLPASTPGNVQPWTNPPASNPLAAPELAPDAHSNVSPLGGPPQSLPQMHARKSGPSLPLGVDMTQAPQPPAHAPGGPSAPKAASSHPPAPPPISGDPLRGSSGRHDGASSSSKSKFDQREEGVRNPAGEESRERRDKAKEQNQRPMDPEREAHMERKRQREAERHERKRERRKVDESGAGGSGEERDRGGELLSKEQREERRRKAEREARRREMMEKGLSDRRKDEDPRRRSSRHPTLDSQGRPRASPSDVSRSAKEKDGRERREEKFRLHPNQPLQPVEHKKRNTLHPNQPLQPPVRGVLEYAEGTKKYIDRKAEVRSARLDENKRLMEKQKSPLTQKEQEAKKFRSAEELKRATGKKERKDPIITPLEKKEKAREAELKKKKMEEDERRRAEASRESATAGIVKMQIQLPSIREYIYLQEMERLTRILPHLAKECGLFFVDLYLTQQPSSKKCVHGVEAIGEREACERFTEEFDKVKTEIQRLIERRLPVDKMQKLPEYGKFLVISPQAYEWCMNNLQEIADGGVTAELRPGGVTSPPLLRLSGPSYRCEELWEYHLNNIRTPAAFPENPDGLRKPDKAQYDIKMMERKKFVRLNHHVNQMNHARRKYGR